MKKPIRLALMVFALFLLAACAVNETKPLVTGAKPDIPTRIDAQQRRIRSDLASKALTPAAGLILLDNLNWIGKRYAGLKVEGKLTAAEMGTLERNSDMIYRKDPYPERLY
jgi:hypothetical protein